MLLDGRCTHRYEQQSPRNLGANIRQCVILLFYNVTEADGAYFDEEVYHMQLLQLVKILHLTKAVQQEARSGNDHIS